MNKAIRYTIRIVGALAAVILLVWVVIGGYVILNRKALVKKARTELQNKTGGDIDIRDIDISYFSHFPSIGLQLSGVTLRDSLYAQHHHDLLKAEQIYIRFSFFSLFTGHPRIDKFFMQKGVICLYTDSTGYSNLLGLLHPKKQDSAAAPQKKEWQFPAISLSNVRFVMDMQNKRKLFDFDISDLECGFENQDRTLLAGVKIDLTVKSFALNTEKGSFLKDKTLSGNFNLIYNTASHIVQGDKMNININGHPFLFSARFFPDVSPDPFSLTIQTSDILYRDAAALITPGIQQKLNEYDIDKPVSLNALIDAGTVDEDNHEPLINIRMVLPGGTVTTPIGPFANCSFTATFNNEYLKGQKRGDENTILKFYPFKGDWENIPLQSDTVRILNLHRPVLSCNVQSNFPLARLNDPAGSSNIRFDKGNGKLSVNFRGPLSGQDSSEVSINGTLDVDTAAVTYLPYQLYLTDLIGRVRFKDQDFYIDRLEGKTGSSKVSIRAAAKNLVSLLGKSPDKINIDCSIFSPRLDIKDFSGLVAQPAEIRPPGKTQNTPLGKTAADIDRMIQECTINLQLDASDINYQNFTGAHAKANLSFAGNEIRLNKMDVRQAVGSLSATGKIKKGGGRSGNPLNIQTHMDQVDISKIFHSFNNFGQKGLTSRNLRGLLTADIQLTGRMTDKAEIIKHSLKGTVKFSLKKGQLVDYEPMMKINESILKQRDLSEIYFAELNNQLDIDNMSVYIHRMEIQSSAVTVFVEGTYDWNKGADLSLQVPLSNLKKRKQGAPPPKQGNDSKAGLSVRLRAKTGDDGQLKVTWDPFKKALKKNR